MTTNLDRIRDDKGHLPAYAWPGGYPILYISKDNMVVCPECANREIDQTQEAVDWFIHYEGPPEFCEDCNAVVESAYGDPEAIT